LTVSVKSLHVLGTTQTGAPNTEPVVFVTSVSVYVMVGLAGLSVPLADGDGAAGAVGPSMDVSVALDGSSVPLEGVAVGAFGPLGEILVDDVLLFGRVRLLLAKLSERKKQLLITKIMAVNARQFDFRISICIGGLLVEFSGACHRLKLQAEMI
jgi:hypothetical protein